MKQIYFSIVIMQILTEFKSQNIFLILMNLKTNVRYEGLKLIIIFARLSSINFRERILRK